MSEPKVVFLFLGLIYPALLCWIVGSSIHVLSGLGGRWTKHQWSKCPASFSRFVWQPRPPLRWLYIPSYNGLFTVCLANGMALGFPESGLPSPISLASPAHQQHRPSDSRAFITSANPLFLTSHVSIIYNRPVFLTCLVSSLVIKKANQGTLSLP